MKTATEEPKGQTLVVDDGKREFEIFEVLIKNQFPPTPASLGIRWINGSSVMFGTTPVKGLRKYILVEIPFEFGADSFASLAPKMLKKIKVPEGIELFLAYSAEGLYWCEQHAASLKKMKVASRNTSDRPNPIYEHLPAIFMKVGSQLVVRTPENQKMDLTGHYILARVEGEAKASTGSE